MWLNPGFWLGIAVALASAYFTGRWHESFSNKERLADARARVGVVEKQLVDVARALEQDRSEALKRVSGRLDTALRELHKRAARRPEAAAPTCEGTTGRELSRPDAEFLEGFAARAESQRAALSECYGWIEKVNNRLKDVR